MTGWFEPESGLLVAKNLVITELDNNHLVYFHDQMHVYWQKLSEGYYFEWTFIEVFNKHTEIIMEMAKREIKHIFPINNLDNVPISHLADKKNLNEKVVTLQEEKNYYVEKKMNGFHIQVHKKGNQVKIFSEQKKDLTNAFPTLIEEIKKLSVQDFIIDGELVPYDEKGNTLGRNALMIYTGAVKSGKHPDDSNIKLHIWDIPYFEKDIIELPLSERIKVLNNLNFSERIKEIERKITKSNIKDLKKNIEWATGLPGSEGALVKDLSASYSFGESSSWKKYRHLTKLIVEVLKVVPKERGLVNYLVGIISDKNSDPKYIQNNKLVLGHTFNFKDGINEGDKIQINIEEVWRHEGKDGIHYSIHKPRVIGKSNEALSTIDYLEDLVTSIGIAIKHSLFEDNEILESEWLAEKKGIGEGKEIEIKNFPDRMQENFKNMIGKWNNYIMHVHTRGKTLHYDIRHKIDSILEGITLFGRSITDRLPIENQRNNIRGTIKMPQPTSWLTFEGTTPPRGIGATTRFPGIFTIISKGKYTIHEVTDHVIRIEYKSDSGKINKNMLEYARKNNLPYASNLPDNLIDLTGKYSAHIAHLGDRHIILFDKLVD